MKEAKDRPVIDSGKQQKRKSKDDQCKPPRKRVTKKTNLTDQRSEEEDDDEGVGCILSRIGGQLKFGDLVKTFNRYSNTSLS